MKLDQWMLLINGVSNVWCVQICSNGSIQLKRKAWNAGSNQWYSSVKRYTIDDDNKKDIDLLRVVRRDRLTSTMTMLNIDGASQG